jgi:hypothetical protein
MPNGSAQLYVGRHRHVFILTLRRHSKRHG